MNGRDVADALEADLVVALQDDQDVLRRSDAREQLDDGLGRRRLAQGERLDDVQAVTASTVGERSTEGRGDHLLGGALSVVARGRSVDDATTGHLGGADRALTSATGSLLLERLAACAGNLATTLGLVRALARCCELGDDDLVDQRDVGLDVEQVGGQLDGAGLLTLHVDDVNRGSHRTRPPSLRCERIRCGRVRRERRP